VVVGIIVAHVSLGIPFEGADALGAGAGAGGDAGVACLTGLAAGAGVGLAAAAGEFELLPPQLATPTAMRRIAAAVAMKVISLLRFMGIPPVRVWIREVPCRRAACRRPEGDTLACNRGGSPSGRCL